MTHRRAFLYHIWRTFFKAPFKQILPVPLFILAYKQQSGASLVGLRMAQKRKPAYTSATKTIYATSVLLTFHLC